jgi:hypothetical protein
MSKSIQIANRMRHSAGLMEAAGMGTTNVKDLRDGADAVENLINAIADETRALRAYRGGGFDWLKVSESRVVDALAALGITA